MVTTDLRDALRITFRGDGSFRIDPNGDWVCAHRFDEALAEIEWLRAEIRKLESHIVDVYNAQEATALRKTGDPS